MITRLLILLAATLALCACEPAHRHHGHKRVHHAKVHTQAHPRPTHALKQIAVHHTSDGRYCYQGDDGFWYWYMYTTMLNGQSHADYYTSTSSSSSSLPRGGGWEKTGFEEPDGLEAAQVVEETVEVGANGQPVSVEQAVTETQTEFAFAENGEADNANSGANPGQMESESESESSEASSESSSDSSSSDSSSSDSGSSGADSGSSGGDSGGSGGGDSGGGGE